MKLRMTAVVMITVRTTQDQGGTRPDRMLMNRRRTLVHVVTTNTVITSMRKLVTQDHWLKPRAAKGHDWDALTKSGAA